MINALAPLTQTAVDQVESLYRLMYCICGVDCVPSHSDCCEPAVHWYSDLVQTHTEVTIDSNTMTLYRLY